jgi:diguanylate cyclase (GGDEF)-like protein/PAS domain S-box-containing protein
MSRHLVEPPADATAALQLELQALRLANAALEAQLLAGAEQAETMFAELERQGGALRHAHGREQTLSAFAQRIMDTVGGLVIVVDAEGRLRQSNRHCQQDLLPVAPGQGMDALLHPADLAVLDAALPRLPWPVQSVLYETVRRHGNYRAEHQLAMRDGSFRFHMVEAAMLYSAQGKEEGAVLSGIDISALKQQEQHLRRSDARFRQAERVAQVGSWELDHASGAMAWSAEMHRLFDTEPGQGASDESLLQAIVPEDRALVAQARAQALRSRVPCDVEFRIRVGQGPERWVHLRSTTFHGEDGQPQRSVGTVQDITARRQAEHEMRLAASVFENSLNAILITDAQGRIRQVNRAFTAITGYSAAEVIGRTPALLKSGQHPREFYDHLWETLNTASRWEGELLNRCKDGRAISVWESIIAVRDQAGAVDYYIGIFSDISEQKASAQRIHQLAYYDVLTGLPNRALLLDRCELALARSARAGKRMAVLFLDLDRFKHINDSLGHPVGDALLKAVARRLRETLREPDTIARLGGDEFVVLLENLDFPPDAEVAARRIVDAFREPFRLEEHTLSVGTTVGISLYPDHGQDVTSLFKFADLALYKAKESGRGDFRFFEARFNEAAHHRMRLENELRLALQRGELTLHYQPVFELRQGRLAGCEALLRWQHPELGSVSPAMFIPVAEDSGLIVPIGAWVLEQACRQARRWLDAGLRLGSMAVNLSGVQIQRDDLADSVQAALAASGLPPALLELEISEAYVMRHAERDLRQLTQLRALGVSLAVDDFGTGQSSLAHLRRLPVGKLKVDRSFMADIDRDQAGATVTRAVIGLGHGLGLTVVAEGVETEAQEQFLREQGCDLVQGFRYSRPLPADQFEARYGSLAPVTGD